MLLYPLVKSIQKRVAVIIPNWNGEDIIKACVDALQRQTCKCQIIVVDNGSVDGSKKILKTYGEKILLLENETNLGFAGGVNTGIRFAQEKNFEYIALLNSDAIADIKWVGELVKVLDNHDECGIVTSRMLRHGGKTIDTTADIYTNWLVHFPRSRDMLSDDRDLREEEVFGATGGGSMYRAELFKNIGLFDEDFFAYYEDVDISFRAQLHGWKIIYTPKAIAYHEVGGTSRKIPGFTTYQTLKNTPLVWFKNLPFTMWPTRVPRFYFLYLTFIAKALLRGQISEVIRSQLKLLILFPKKLNERWKIQRGKTVSNDYLRKIIYKGLPPETKQRLPWAK